MRMPADQRRTQLLEVAREVFTAGFHATSMDDVALAAGVTKPVLYQHFPSKRGLFVELLQQVGSELLTELAAATSQAGSGREQVEQGFTVYFRFVVGNPSSFRLLFGASVRNDPEFAAVVQEVIDAVAETISGLIDVPTTDEHRAVLAHALVGMAEALGRRTLTHPAAEHDPERLARWASELVWFGLRGVRADNPTPA
jgi:AcrR family transcriptional regulator